MTEAQGVDRHRDSGGVRGKENETAKGWGGQGGGEVTAPHRPVSGAGAPGFCSLCSLSVQGGWPAW